MGFVGIIFEREYDIPLLIFTEKKELTINQVIGFDQIVPKKYETIFLDSLGNKKKVIFLEESTFIYSKISLGEKKVVDYIYRTFWFAPKTYKILRDLLYVREVNKKDYSLRFVEVLSYF